MPCTPGVRLQDRSWMFIRQWRIICIERHFHTPPVRICTAPRSRTRTAELGCVYKLHQSGRARSACTPGVHLRDPSRQFIGPWRAICCERYFCTTPVWNCTALQIRTRTAHLGFLYTTCTKLEDPVGPCTTGVRLPDRSGVFTRPWQTICSETHFHTHPVRICTAPGSRTRTAHLGYVYTTCIKLGGPVGPCTHVCDSQTTHGCSPDHGKQSAVKGICIHLLYGFVRLCEVGPAQLN